MSADMSLYRPSGNGDYAELQVITNFSFLRGGSHPHELVAAAAEQGLAAIAIADCNTLAGVVRAHLAASEVGIRLVVGARLDLRDGPSLLCFPTDRQAYGRLSRLLSVGQGRAEKGDCKLFLDDVGEHAEGMIFIALAPQDWDWREVLRANTDGGVDAAVEADAATNRVVALPAHTVEAATSVREQGDPAHRASSTSATCAGSASATCAGSTSATRSGSTPAARSGSASAARSGSAPAARSGSAPAARRATPPQLPGAERRNSSARQIPDHGPDQPDQPDQPKALRCQLRRLKSALGHQPLYLAASHRYCGDDRARIGALAKLAEECAMALVATNDVIYHAPERRPLQDVLTCIREKTTVREAGFRLAANAERHIKSPAEMLRLFAGFEEAVRRTGEIVEACRFSLDELHYEYPDEPVPLGHSPQSYLEEITWQGARRRFPDAIPAKVSAAIDKELALIAKLDYAPYFLTVHDIVRYARGQGILCQGRGSAANSVVCYCLAITAVNPTEVDLLFERFVSPERREPPDIDVDFEHERREEVIQYLYARYGRDRAGLAATVITYRSRSAVREVGKAMGLSEDSIAALAGMVWGSLSNASLPAKHVREAGFNPADPLIRTVVALSDELIGFPRHLSQHVGGFVLTRGPLVEVVPVGNAAMDDRTFIEWDKDDLEALGLLKVDVLALGMLSCIRRAFDLLAQHHRRTETLASVPRDDPAVYDMLCKADSLGVFQVESRAQMNMLPRLKPRCYYDLVIEVAIVRPGPIQGDMVHPYLRRRDGLEPETYPSPHPHFGAADELRQILSKTKGVPLFQEQAMRIAMEAAKFSNAEVNELRKAMATFRRKGTIGKLEEKMISRMVARGYDAGFAQRCFNQIKGFGEYGFPESHAASFAHLVYISSWLKCHYPAVFCCAILNAQPMGFYAPAQLVRDAREHGVEVRPVDVNHSDWDCTLEPTNDAARPAVRLGMRQVDGLRKDDGEKIQNCRRRLAAGKAGAADNGGRPLIFADPYDVMHLAGASRAALERLAAGDAFRSTGRDRRRALWDVRGLTPAEQLPLFEWSGTRESGHEPQVDLPEMPLGEHVVNDYQTLRLSLKAHPMVFLRQRLRNQGVASCRDLRGMRDGGDVSIAGVVLVRQRPGSAKGVVFMTIEDETGVANAVVWPKTLERYRKVIMTARLIFIRGRIQRHADIIHVVSNRLEDRSAWLGELSEWAKGMSAPIANADEVRRPEPGSARNKYHPRWAGHPRNERIIPKSRDFH